MFSRLFIIPAWLCAYAISAQNTTTAQYIAAYKDIAMQEMKQHGIPASITLAQGILESASGNSKLAKDCNNHFGIKCRKNWTAKFCLADDDAPNECFRGYESAQESYKDHSTFLKENSRYATLFTYAVTDYSSWAHGLRTAGYATNPAYGSSLISVIEKHKLSAFDSMVVLGADYVPAVPIAGVVNKEINGVPVMIAGEGQTPESIATANEMASWQIYKYNDLKRGEKIKPGDIVYLKPKRRSGDIPVHIVQNRETVRSVSQLHGIKMKHVYKKNDLKPGQKLNAGDMLYLQKKKEEQQNNKMVATDSGKQKTAAPVASENNTGTLLPETLGDHHLVKAGETLYSIARRYRLTVEDLSDWNNLKSTNIKVGQKLTLISDGQATENTEKQENELSQASLRPVVSKFHIVQKGETLYRIAKKYGVTLDSIRKLNGIQGDAIQAGQKIELP